MPFAEDAGAVAGNIDPIDRHGARAAAKCGLEHRPDIDAQHVEAVAQPRGGLVGGICGNKGPAGELRGCRGRVRRLERELKRPFELLWETWLR